MPPDQRTNYHCEREATGPVNRKQLIDHINKIALETPDQPESVPFVAGVVRGKKVILPAFFELFFFFIGQVVLRNRPSNSRHSVSFWFGYVPPPFFVSKWFINLLSICAWGWQRGKKVWHSDTSFSLPDFLQPHAFIRLDLLAIRTSPLHSLGGRIL